MDKQKIGDRIKELRKESCMTQEQLAEKLDFNNRTINLIEKSKCGITIDTLINICNIFDVSPNYILSYGKSSNNISDLAENFTPSQLEIAKQFLVTLIKFKDLNSF